MEKEEALKVAAKMLNKLLASDNADADLMDCQSFVLTAEAERNYGKMWHALEELRTFIVKLKNALKSKL